MTSIHLTEGDRHKLNSVLDFQFESFYPFYKPFAHLFIDTEGDEHEVLHTELRGVIPSLQ